MTAAEVVTWAIAILTVGGCGVTCWIDPAGLADKKYGKRAESGMLAQRRLEAQTIEARKSA